MIYFGSWLHKFRQKKNKGLKKKKGWEGWSWTAEGLDLVRRLSFISSFRAAGFSVFLCWVHLRVGPCGWQLSHCGAL